MALPTQLGGDIPRRAAWQQEFDLRVRGLLEKSHIAIRDVPLKPDERSCGDTGCARKIADSYSADVVVGARVFLDAAVPPNYHVAAWALDRAKPSDRFLEERVCATCSEFQAAEVLSDLAAKVIRQLGAGEAVTLPEPTRPQPAPVPVSRAQKAMRGLGIALGAVGVAGLIYGGVEAGRNNKCVSSSSDPAPHCVARIDTKTDQIIGFVGGSVALVGAAVLSYFGWRTRPSISAGANHALIGLVREF